MKQENNRIEYKQTLTDGLEKEVVAFLNSNQTDEVVKTDDIGRLTLEQKLIIKYLEDSSHINRAEAMSLLKLQRSQTDEILKSMVEADLLIRKGQGRGTYYEMKEND